MIHAWLNDRSVYAWDTSLAQGDAFTCPHCKWQMALKRGHRVTAHFAHFPHGICSYNKPESELHNLMKTDLCRLLPGAKTEQAYKDIEGAITFFDIVWGKYAIECQASAIGRDEVYQREACAEYNGLKLLWLLGRGAGSTYYGDNLRQCGKGYRKLKDLEYYLSSAISYGTPAFRSRDAVVYYHREQPSFYTITERTISHPREVFNKFQGGDYECTTIWMSEDETPNMTSRVAVLEAIGLSTSDAESAQQKECAVTQV